MTCSPSTSGQKYGAETPRMRQSEFFAAMRETGKTPVSSGRDQRGLTATRMLLDGSLETLSAVHYDGDDIEEAYRHEFAKMRLRQGILDCLEQVDEWLKP